MLETVMSYRLDLAKDDMVQFKLYKDEDHFIGLKELRDLLSGLCDADVRILACLHEWEFAPFNQSTIDCGHGDRWNSPYDLLASVWLRLSYRTDTEADKAALGIVEAALDQFKA